MGFLLALLSQAVIGVLTAAVLRWAGVAKKPATWAGVGAGVAAAVLVAAAGLVSLGECLNDNASPPPAWYWSPRAQFCDEGFPEALSWLVVFLVPSGPVIVGTLLRSRGHGSGTRAVRGAARGASPSVPLSRLAGLLPAGQLSGSRSATFETGSSGNAVARLLRLRHRHRSPQGRGYARDDGPLRRVARTPEALSLTLAYDGGRTVTDLTRMGQNLTRDGLPVTPGRTGVHGLIVRRVFRLPDR